MTPNMRDLHNTRMLPQTSHEILPASVVDENANFEQHMRTTASVSDKPKFYPCNSHAARRDLANSSSCARSGSIPPNQSGPAWAHSGNPQWQPAVRHTIGGQPAPARPAFRPSSASAARDQIKSRVTLWSHDDNAIARERRQQLSHAKEMQAEYATKFATAGREQPRTAWAKAT